MKPQAAVQPTTDATVLEKSYRRTPTTLGHLLEDLLRAITALFALAAVVLWWLMATPAAEAAAAGAPHTGLEGEPVAEAIRRPRPRRQPRHRCLMRRLRCLSQESRKFDARNPPRQTRMTASLPSLLDFAICCSQRNSSLWGSPSMMQSKIQYSGSGATPSPSRTLVATMTRSASTSPSAWTRLHLHGSSHSRSTRSTSGISSRSSSPATSRAPWDARVLAWTWPW
jgi:hypothetical protein